MRSGQRGGVFVGLLVGWQFDTGGSGVRGMNFPRIIVLVVFVLEVGSNE